MSLDEIYFTAILALQNPQTLYTFLLQSVDNNPKRYDPARMMALDLVLDSLPDYDRAVLAPDLNLTVQLADRLAYASVSVRVDLDVRVHLV